MTSLPARVALVGLRGSGKTTLGRVLADRLGLPFHDADQVLQQNEGCSIAQIFAEKGQEWFRRREAQCLAELARQDRWVIACGGGVVLREENRALLSRRALVVWLDADPEILARRVDLDPQSSATRPALIASTHASAAAQAEQDRGVEEISRELTLLARQREDWYRSVSQFRLDTGSGTPAEWVSHFLRNLDSVENRITPVPDEGSGSPEAPWR